MPDVALQPMTVEAFFAWQSRQTDRYELVHGVPIRLMAGARNAHDDIVVNLLSELRRQLRGTGCRPFTGDGSVVTRPGQIRRPDAGVDCGRRDPDAMAAALPRLVIEVLSPTTRDFDTFEKLAEYREVESIDDILVVEPNTPEVTHWTRMPDRSWTRHDVAGIEHEIAIAGLGLTLALAEIYEDVAFPPRPRLVQSGV